MSTIAKTFKKSKRKENERKTFFLILWLSSFTKLRNKK